MYIISLRQDLLDFQDFFAFPACPVENGKERQKPKSLFEGVCLIIKAQLRSDSNVRKQYYDTLLFYFSAESRIVISQIHLEFEKTKINPNDPVNPVQY